jgi:hypothetical protein
MTATANGLGKAESDSWTPDPPPCSSAGPMTPHSGRRPASRASSGFAGTSNPYRRADQPRRQPRRYGAVRHRAPDGCEAGSAPAAQMCRCGGSVSFVGPGASGSRGGCSQPICSASFLARLRCTSSCSTLAIADAGTHSCAEKAPETRPGSPGPRPAPCPAGARHSRPRPTPPSGPPCASAVTLRAVLRLP